MNIIKRDVKFAKQFQGTFKSNPSSPKIAMDDIQKPHKEKTS